MNLPPQLTNIWNDTGWRAIIIAWPLIFALEAGMESTGTSGGSSIGWTAMTVSLVLIGRMLTLRPLRGDLSTVENRSLVLGVVLILVAEIATSWTTLGASWGGETFYWPFAILFAVLLVAARLIAPMLRDPLDWWLLFFAFVNFWMQAGMSVGNVAPPAASLTWAVMLIGAAILVRGVVGRGFGGPFVSPLNVAVVIFGFLTLWLEVGAYRSGVGDIWVRQELYWPWLLFSLGIAAGARVATPHIVRLVGAEEPKQDSS